MYYDRVNAVMYALRYLQEYNPDYPDWTGLGGDCTNFISQCLYAGGKPMEGIPGTHAAAQDWNNWFSKGSRPSIVNVSSTWRGAAAFRDYWQTHAKRYQFFTSISLKAYEDAQIGDVISLLNIQQAAYHTLMIVEKEKGDFKVAAHTDSFIKNGKPYFLGKRPLEKGFILYNMD